MKLRSALLPRLECLPGIARARHLVFPERVDVAALMGREHYDAETEVRISVFRAAETMAEDNQRGRRRAGLWVIDLQRNVAISGEMTQRNVGSRTRVQVCACRQHKIRRMKSHPPARNAMTVYRGDYFGPAYLGYHLRPLRALKEEARNT